jgi:hypothetical protein
MHAVNPSQNRPDGFVVFAVLVLSIVSVWLTYTHPFQAKEFLANPDAFVVAAAPVAETAAAADTPKEEAKPAEEEAESDDDMVSHISTWFMQYCQAENCNCRASVCLTSWLVYYRVPLRGADFTNEICARPILSRDLFEFRINSECFIKTVGGIHHCVIYHLHLIPIVFADFQFMLNHPGNCR